MTQKPKSFLPIKMRAPLLFLILICFSASLTAQCLEGDCENGYGKIDMGWVVYEGTFKEGIPEGAGTFFYEDYRYEGQVSQGLENGKGRIIYDDGNFEEVTYEMGKKQESQYIKTAAEDWKSYEAKGDPYCVSGNCANGTGEYHFPSGNVYKGPFKDYQPHGLGSWSFANGDRFEGSVVNGQKQGQGSYYFADGWIFSGSYKEDAEFTGTYTSPEGRKVEMIGGVVQIPEPKVTITYEIAEPTHEKCLMCDGSGTMVIPGRSRYVQGSPSYVTYRDGNGNVSREYAGSAPVYTVRDPDKEVTCNICGGSGVMPR